MIFIDEFNTSFYFHFKSPSYQDLINKLFSEEEIDSDKYSWKRSCIVQTTELQQKEYEYYIDAWVEEIKNFYGKNFDYKIDDLWMNTYNKGGFQEIHDHFKSDLVFVFFANYEKDFSNLYFYSRCNILIPQNLQNIVAPIGADKFIPPVEAGDVVGFPATLLHGVTPHKSDIKRKTLSCNISLTTS